MVRTLLLTAAISGLMISGAWSQSAINGGNEGAKFVASQSPDQLVWSRFKGTDVVGPNDEIIGGVNDLLFDKSGKIFGVIVGVGGFLGIGQKNVAIDMGAFQVVPASVGSTTAPVTGRSSDPSEVKLKVAWTKDDIQKAPDFQYYKPPSESASNGTTGMGQRRNPNLPPPAGTQ
jgi:PRC-barrel domain